jgi:Protein of unknown function (DUF2281)
MVQPALLEKLEDLSEDLQSEVLQYVELLIQAKQVSQPIQSAERLEPKPQHGYGSWAGQIIMSEDFDEPIEDFAELG